MVPLAWLSKAPSSLATASPHGAFTFKGREGRGALLLDDGWVLLAAGYDAILGVDR